MSVEIHLEQSAADNTRHARHIAKHVNFPFIIQIGIAIDIIIAKICENVWLSVFRPIY